MAKNSAPCFICLKAHSTTLHLENEERPVCHACASIFVTLRLCGLQYESSNSVKKNVLLCVNGERGKCSSCKLRAPHVYPFFFSSDEVWCNQCLRTVNAKAESEPITNKKKRRRGAQAGNEPESGHNEVRAQENPAEHVGSEARASMQAPASKELIRHEGNDSDEKRKLEESLKEAHQALEQKSQEKEKLQKEKENLEHSLILLARRTGGK